METIGVSAELSAVDTEFIINLIIVKIIEPVHNYLLQNS